MILSIEKIVLTLIGIALMVFMISGPVIDIMKTIEDRRDENCVNVALKSIDLAVTNAIGGGLAESYVFLPTKVSYECRGNEIVVTAGDHSGSLSYPFALVCGGEAHFRGSFHATWKRGTDGRAVLYLNWERG